MNTTLKNNLQPLSFNQLLELRQSSKDNLIELARIGEMLARSPALKLLEKGEEGSNLSFWLQQTTMNKQVERATHQTLKDIAHEIKRRKRMVGNETC